MAPQCLVAKGGGWHVLKACRVVLGMMTCFQHGTPVDPASCTREGSWNLQSNHFTLRDVDAQNDKSCTMSIFSFTKRLKSSNWRHAAQSLYLHHHPTTMPGEHFNDQPLLLRQTLVLRRSISSMPSLSTSMTSMYTYIYIHIVVFFLLILLYSIYSNHFEMSAELT